MFVLFSCQIDCCEKVSYDRFEQDIHRIHTVNQQMHANIYRTNFQSRNSIQNANNFFATASPISNQQDEGFNVLQRNFKKCEEVKDTKHNCSFYLDQNSLWSMSMINPWTSLFLKFGFFLVLSIWKAALLGSYQVTDLAIDESSISLPSWLALAARLLSLPIYIVKHCPIGFAASGWMWAEYRSEHFRNHHSSTVTPRNSSELVPLAAVHARIITVHHV